MYKIVLNEIKHNITQHFLHHIYIYYHIYIYSYIYIYSLRRYNIIMMNFLCIRVDCCWDSFWPMLGHFDAMLEPKSLR